ncbi:MAG TPA: hypothetical protein VJ957_10145 [Longimicrobiales bacterium]|nr:hypothetical protein [Longimicrobiales bacterium]
MGLAVVGVVAVIWRLLRSLLRLARRVSDAVWASEIARARARRGDLTGMRDAQAEADAARRARDRAAVVALLWAFLLVAPAALPWTRVLYAVLALTWVMPKRRGVQRT